MGEFDEKHALHNIVHPENQISDINDINDGGFGRKAAAGPR